MINTANKVLRKIGYSVYKVSNNAGGNGYVLYGFQQPDGSFDYDRYKEVQVEGNKRKLGQTFVDESNIEFASNYLKRKLQTISFGICHGTRRGNEQRWFKERLGCEVIGTEISDTAAEFPDTIQWDFHDVKPEWVAAVDFIYSNSIDHSYDPEKALNAWMSCLRPGGICILEHTSMHETQRADELDPFGAQLTAMPYLIATWAKGRYALVDLLALPVVKQYHSHFLCLSPVT